MRFSRKELGLFFNNNKNKNDRRQIAFFACKQWEEETSCYSRLPLGTLWLKLSSLRKSDQQQNRFSRQWLICSAFLGL